MTELSRPLSQVTVCGPNWNNKPFWQLKALTPHPFADLSRHTRQQEDRVHSLRTLAMYMTADEAEQTNKNDKNDKAKLDSTMRRPRLVALQLLAGQGRAWNKKIADRNDIAFGSYEAGFQYGTHETKYKTRIPCPAAFDRFTPNLDLSKEYFVGDANRTESFSIQLNSDAVVEVASKQSWIAEKRLIGKELLLVTPSYFRTGRAIDEDPTATKNVQFQHVVATPILSDAQAWLPNYAVDPQSAKKIPVPPMRLLEGAIDLAVADGAFPWLGKFQPSVSSPSSENLITRFGLRLTPDGIELTTSVNFPGQSEPLKGRFLLGPETISENLSDQATQSPASRLMLTFLPDKTDQFDLPKWQSAWQAVIPGSGSEEVLHGFRIAAQADVVPAFRWEVLVAGNKPKNLHLDGLSPVVEIPAQHIRLELLSPRSNGGIDGVVNVSGGYFYLLEKDLIDGQWKNHIFGSAAEAANFTANLDAQLLLAWSKPAQETPISQLRMTGGIRNSAGVIDENELAVELTGGDYLCTHDEIHLAEQLRQAYGLPALQPGVWDPERPLLYGFVPMNDGWLQLPVPNCPLLDNSLDSALAVASGAKENSVLAGYLRYQQQGALPLVQSAFVSGNAPAPNTQAPWSVTVEGAQGLRVVVALKMSMQNSTPIATPTRAMALLDEPKLSTRGLLWFSADRPDAIEALPRLGAGPGAYLNLALARDKPKSDAIFTVALNDLKLTATAGNGGANNIADAVTRRDRLGLELRFNKAGLPKSVPFAEDKLKIISVYWQRHPKMPLVAQMPMTRTASSAVRPLESRDLVPFEVSAKEVQTSTQQIFSLAELNWTQAVFAQMAARTYTVHSEWPWPESKKSDQKCKKPEQECEKPGQECKKSVDAELLPVNGIGLCAFGVPGVELRLSKSEFTNPWAKLQVALRYDLPVLDEAFASATLPHVAAQDDTNASTPAATALDIRALAHFWAEQNRRHQLARVAHSYLADYSPINIFCEKTIKNLVGGLDWTTNAGFVEGTAEGSLLYGALSLNGKMVAGNDALLGYSANFSVDIDKKMLVPNEDTVSPDVRVVGYSPSYFLKDGFLLDARGSGAAQVKQIGSGVGKGLWRALKALVTPLPDKTWAAGLLSCELVLNIASDQIGGPRLFRFWYKDVPLDHSGKFTPDSGINTAAWQDGHLLQSGFEWRLLASSGHAGFEKGDDCITFCGMQLEPLQLLELEVPMAPERMPSTTLPNTVKILARLSLQAEQEWPDNGNSLLELRFAAMEGGLYLQSVAVSAINTGPILRLPLVLAQKSVLLHFGSAAWLNGQLQLQQAQMSFDFLDADVTLAGIAVAIDPAKKAAWEFKSRPATSEKTNVLQITEAVLTVDGSNSALKLTYEVRVSPQMNSVVQTKNPAILIKGTEHWPNAPGNADLPDLFLLGATAKVRLTATRRAFSVTAQATDDDGVDLHGSLLPGFPSDGKLQFGMLASIDKFDEKGAANLEAGQLGGRIVKTRRSRCMTLTAMDFSATCQQRGNDSAPAGSWRGALQLYGSISVRNAISWPQIDLSKSSQEIPFPPSDSSRPPLQSSLTKVVLLGDKNYLHDVQWLLDGHAISFDLMLGMCDSVTTAVWSVPVMARHTLTLPGAESPALEFSCVEALAMGSMAALLPPWDGADHDANARNTFAPRYRDQISMGNDTGKRTPGMLHAGHGGLGTVLQGALSGTFRAACYASGAKEEHIVLVGGFVGMLLKDETQKEAPLMRLPVLAGLHEGPLFFDRKSASKPPVTQRQVPAQGLMLAWSDGAAVPQINVTLRHGVASKGWSERALRDAMASGNLIRELEALGDPQMAILVEQSFPRDLIGSLPLTTDAQWKVALETLPFFIAAAVSIERTIQMPSLTAAQTALSMSLLAGSDISRKQKGKMQRIAALLLTRHSRFAANALSNTAAASSLQPAPAILMLVADDLVSQTWDGPSIAEVPQPVALVASKAYAAHRRPRAALLRDASGRYTPITIPAHQLQLQKREVVNPVFADSGRGYALTPGETEAWLAGPEEGGAMAMRDYAKDGAGNGSGSGIAGFSRNACLRPSASDGPPIWLGQQRVPIYLPLQTTELSGSAIPWLTPGAPRTRLPTDVSVKQKQENFSAKDQPEKWQTIVPQQVMSASLSDRPGILMARRMRLESTFAASVWSEGAGTPSSQTFDSEHQRFGQPAQAGSSLARTERTPRPGPLPPNTNDLGVGGKSNPRFFRRPCASPLLPLVPLRAVIGPADTVHGKVEKDTQDAWEFSDWSVTFIAAPETAGVITQASDGTLGMIAEIDVWPQTKDISEDDWKKILLSLLFVDGSDKKVIKASAVLLIDSLAMRFNALHVRQAENVVVLPGTEVRRGRVALIWDARTSALAAAGSKLPALPNALSGKGRLPEVVLQLTVYPASSLPTASDASKWKLDDLHYPLSGSVATLVDLPVGLSKGDARAPVSLRMGLSPVLQDGGALPLQNATLLFTDPAYDIDLAAPPHDDRRTLLLTEKVCEITPEKPKVKNCLTGVRGELELVLYVDRGRVNRRATVTLMADVRYEKSMDARLQTLLGKNVDGDLMPGQDVKFKLALRVQPRLGNKRDVFLSKPGGAIAPLQIRLAQVYELALSALCEADGKPANLFAGDILELELEPQLEPNTNTWELTMLADGLDVPLPSTRGFTFIEAIKPATPPTVRLVLTNEPVIAPPPALYAALMHKTVVAKLDQAAASVEQLSLSVPLYAQSPLPWRVDLQNAKVDFRAGLMQRSATFIWSLARPSEEFGSNAMAVHIVKSDRNGQTYLPSSVSEDFVKPERFVWPLKQ